MRHMELAFGAAEATAAPLPAAGPLVSDGGAILNGKMIIASSNNRISCWIGIKIITPGTVQHAPVLIIPSDITCSDALFTQNVYT